MRPASASRHARRFGILAGLVLVLAVSGCAQHDLDLGRGGFSAEDDARLSLAFAQVRAQAPKDSVSGLVYEARREPAGLPEPELALIGEADSMARGFQTAPKSHLKISVYLDKGSYTRGYVKVIRDQGSEEIWSIVAYLLRGQADKDFQFTYLLAEPNGALRTLMLMGGGYKDQEDDLIAIEGALFIPDPEPHDKHYSPAEWKIAYPLAFMLNEPQEPAYETLTSQAQDLAKEVEDDVAELNRLTERLDALRSKAAADQPQDGTATPPKDSRLPDLEREIRERSTAAQDKVVHYFDLRGEADTAFAEYLDGNAYRWKDANGRDEAFKNWEAPDQESADLDTVISQLLAYVQGPAKIEQARASYAAVVAKHRNADKRPAPVAK